MKNKSKSRKRTMALSILGIILGVILIVVGVFGIRAAVHSKTPKEGYGDYLFDDGNADFDLDLFPSLVIDEKTEQLKILQIADPQIKFGSFPHRDRKTMDLLKRAIKNEKPDLCVVTGDLTLSLFSYDAFKYFADFMQKLNVKWAFVYGNHDAQFDCSKYTIHNLLKQYDNCLFAKGPSDVYGESNYLVNVFKGSKSAKNLAYSLVMLDSGMYPQSGNASLSDWVYDWIHQDQIDWYNWAIDGLQRINPNVQTSMFFHIPTKEFADMYYADRLAKGKEIPPQIDASVLKEVRDVVGIVRESDKKDNELIDDGYSAGIYYQGKDTTATSRPDIFAAIKQQDCTKAVFCGHDHVNTLKGYYDGVYLGYGLCCGYHTYPFFNKFPSNKITLNGSLWVDDEGNLMEKGVTVIEVNLKAQGYGELTVTDRQDSYYKK